VEFLAPNRIRYTDRSGRSESLHRLRSLTGHLFRYNAVNLKLKTVTEECFRKHTNDPSTGSCIKNLQIYSNLWTCFSCTMVSNTFKSFFCPGHLVLKQITLKKAWPNEWPKHVPDHNTIKSCQYNRTATVGPSFISRM
jgi:hypothetical protein